MSVIDTVPVTSPKRVAILDAAQSCFLDHGFADTSMDAVASRAGVSKATIYAHFNGKLDLFAAVIGQGCDEHFSQADYWPVGPADARTTLSKMGERLLAFLVMPRVLALHRVLVSEGIRCPDLAQAFWKAGPARSVPRFASVFAELDRRGELKVPDPTAAAILFVGMMKSEFFFCRLLNLPLGTEHISAEDTVRHAVDLTVRAYGVE